MPREKAANISLPGFGRPLDARNAAPEKFPMALLNDEAVAYPLTTREYTMMELMNRLTDKPDWERKVFDETIVGKWRQEMLAINETGLDVSEKMIDWCIAELRYKVDDSQKTGCVETLDGVWKSDTLVSGEDKEALRRAVAPLEDVPEREKDWHPDTNQQVLDLVHPSLYPLVYGQSKILPDRTCGMEDCMSCIGQGQTLEKIPDDQKFGPEWSRTFQWLPAEFETPAGTEDVRMKSYINNLRPDRHQELYSIIARITAKAITLWNRTLVPHQFVPARIQFADGFTGYAQADEPDQEEGEDDEEYYDRMEEWRDKREIVQPEPGEFKPPVERHQEHFRGERAFTSEIDLRQKFRKLQIIVKLANIHLSPEKPTYEGGTWHVEGQANESIVATALYYYDSDNISESLLAFRQQVDDGADLPYEQNDHRAVETIYNIENEESRIQNLGKVVTRDGRLLAFPNILQHRVKKFGLVDPTKPGHRKILALFLVDPHFPIISTANVPPQQKTWWKDMIEQSNVLANLPQEISDTIVGMTSFPISLEETKAQRLKLMGERKNFVTVQDAALQEYRFSLCEH